MQQTLLIMFDDFNKDLKESVGITICKCTYLRYVRTRNLLAEFLKKNTIYLTSVYAKYPSLL